MPPYGAFRKIGAGDVRHRIGAFLACCVCDAGTAVAFASVLGGRFWGGLSVVKPASKNFFEIPIDK